MKVKSILNEASNAIEINSGTQLRGAIKRVAELFSKRNVYSVPDIYRGHTGEVLCHWNSLKQIYMIRYGSIEEALHELKP